MLISRSNTDELVGANCYVEHDVPNLFLSDLLWEISARRGISLNMKWLSYLLNSEYYRARIIARANGTSGSMKKITKPSFLGIYVPFPTLREQMIIAEILSAWDAAIEQTRKLIEAKKRRKKALMQQLLTGNCRLSGAKQPWKEYKLFQLLQTRNDFSNKTNDLPLYSLTINEGVTPKTDRYNREALVKDKHKKQYKIVFPNDIVFNPPNIRWGAIARSKLSFPVLVSPTYEVLRVKDNSTCHPVFLSELLSTENQIRKFASRVEGTLVERMAVKLNAFLTTKVNTPTDIVEQKHISEVLSVAENEVQTLKAKFSVLEKQKRGLMQKLLTGDVRVEA